MTTPEERAEHIYDASVCSYLDRDTDFEQAKANIIEHGAYEIRAAIADATRWIPVEERLPNSGRFVLIMCGGVVFTGYYEGDHTRPHWLYCTPGGEWRDILNVTHWRHELPDPPEEQPND